MTPKTYLHFLLLAPFALAQEHATTLSGPTPQEVLEKLRHGNQEFAAGRIDTSHLSLDRRAELAKGQKPFASVLSCADSRVPPEDVFGQGLGDLFVVRVAGAVAEPGALGSLEYASEHLGSHVIIVMGHTSCGAVKAALDAPVAPVHPSAAQANLESLLLLIRPALARPMERGDVWTSAVYASVEETVQDVISHSPALGAMVHKGEITIVGAVYQLETGKVVFSKPIAFHE